jgi:hypothetical protein
MDVAQFDTGHVRQRGEQCFPDAILQVRGNILKSSKIILTDGCRSVLRTIAISFACEIIKRRHQPITVSSKSDYDHHLATVGVLSSIHIMLKRRQSVMAVRRGAFRRIQPARWILVWIT